MAALTTETQARRILDRALALVRAQKGAAATASLDHVHAGNTRFAVSEITSSAGVERMQLSVTVQLGKRVATATTNQLDDHAVADAVARAARIARLAPENPEAMPPLGAQTYRPAKAASDAATAALGPDVRAAAAGAAIGTAGDKTSIAGFHEHAARVRAIASTAGAWGYHAWTDASMSCTARTPDGSGSGWAGTSSHRAKDVDGGALARVAVDKAVTSQKPQRLDAGRYTVILEPAAVADLMSFLVGALGARRADEGRSFFSKPGGGTRVGDKLFPETITLRSDPTDAQLTATPFDREQVAIAPATWIDKGVLKGLVYGRYWASTKSKPVTGQPDGFILDGGKVTRDELIKGTKRGVLITRFWYLRSLDPQTLMVTGLTRDGVYLIENGAIARPVNNFRFNESPVQMLARCDGMTATAIAGGMRVPTLRSNEFNLASISEAV